MKPIVNCQNQTDDFIVHNELFLDVYYEDILIIIHPKNQTKKIKPFFRQKQNAYLVPIYSRFQMAKNTKIRWQALNDQDRAKSGLLWDRKVSNFNTWLY